MHGAPTVAGGRATNRHEHKLLQKVAARNNIMHVHALESSTHRRRGKKIVCRERERGRQVSSPAQHDENANRQAIITHG